MQFLKVTCAKCKHYTVCPQQTRLYVNYCGSDHKGVEEKVQDAMHECRARRGYLFKRHLMIDAISLTGVKASPAIVTS